MDEQVVSHEQEVAKTQIRQLAGELTAMSFGECQTKYRQYMVRGLLEKQSLTPSQDNLRFWDEVFYTTQLTQLANCAGGITDTVEVVLTDRGLETRVSVSPNGRVEFTADAHSYSSQSPATYQRFQTTYERDASGNDTIHSRYENEAKGVVEGTLYVPQLFPKTPATVTAVSGDTIRKVEIHKSK